MTFTLRNISLLILVSSFISCNGQVKNDNSSLEAEKVTEVIKIPLPNNGFSNGYVDIDGTLWFTSNGGGVYHFDGKTYKNYTMKDGLSSNQVFSIASDHKNNLWFGTQNGLTKYDRKSLNKYRYHTKTPPQVGFALCTPL
ncbi:MAG: hypothetical protein IPK10_13105 [Bacteroidetes bacterium]|nr:hypothetical protein [Bacteroidota bacterium]